MGGEFDLAWNAADNPVARLPAALEASATVSIRIDSRNINSEARLTVRSAGGDFDRFQVRLPPAAEFVTTPQVGATIVPVDAAAKGKLYEVKLAKKSAGPQEVRIVTQRAYDPQRADEAVELAGFEVIGAVRQWGTLAVAVEGNWQLKWDEMRHVRQVDELAGLMRRDDRATAFEYSAQPYSLAAHIVPQTTRTRVEGDYLVLVGSDEAPLRGKLKYTIRGAKIRSLEVDVSGWDVDLIGPASLVNVDAVSAGQNSPLVIPLLQAMSGEVEVTFEARQQVALQGGKISLRLPVATG